MGILLSSNAWTETSINQSIHQSIHPSINQSINQSWAHVTQALVSSYILTSQTNGQAAKYNSKWRRAVLNFGPLWRGISVGSDALQKLKPRSVTQLSVTFLLAISSNTPFLEWPSPLKYSCVLITQTFRGNQCWFELAWAFKLPVWVNGRQL